MVSTRGIKLKFSEGERVLCYEPDPTKAKVLYDSKVLQIVFNKDQRGKKTVEYLIHFQGWNSSWDRCVGEEFVLKDTPENRQLQKDLAEKSQLQLGAYLYRKERKKSRKVSGAALSSEDGSSGSPARMDTDDGHGSSSSEESSLEEETIQIDIGADLRQILEMDYYNINTKNKLVKLPAEPNVVSILEMYYRHYATNQICGLSEKPANRYRLIKEPPKLKAEDVQRNLNICREIMEGLRIYFDFTVNDLLLYKQEQGQVETRQAVYESLTSLVKVEIKQEDMDCSDLHLNHSSQIDYTAQNGTDKVNARRRTLRSNRNDSQTNGNANSDSINNNNNNVKPCSSVNNIEIPAPLAKTVSWRLLPEHIYLQQPPPPCLVYGATHLTRLLVKLPELLTASSICENQLKVLLQHLHLFIDFLNEHKDWYGESCYIEVS